MEDTKTEKKKHRYSLSTRNDLLTGLVVIFAILIFVGTGGTVINEAIASLAGYGGGSDKMLVSAFLLNIALIIFGWRRYRDLAAEVAEHAAAEKRAHSLAITDPLTGCLNCRTLVKKTEDMIAAVELTKKSTAFLMLDLDNFKVINDTHGHSAGDFVLKEVVARISATLPPDNLLVRLGGDEFACAFIYDPERPEMVDRIADDLISNIAMPVFDNGNHLAVTTSIGIACLEADCDDADALIRRADIAMYSAKKQGRNRYCWFDISMENELRTRDMIEAGIRKGISAGEFIPYYEQQIDLATGRLAGFEVLARWNSPEQGLVSPDIFIPIAEETGMIGELSLCVMRQAFEDAKTWDQEITISVNISPIQFRDRWLAQKIVKLLVETGFPANRLEIEITETAILEDLALAQSILGSLANQGVSIALDGFGIGYSSLTHLNSLPFNRIKIDHSHVSSMLHNTGNAAIVNAIAGIAKNLDIPFAAEGVESKLIEEELRNIGCGTAQGWHYGRPLSYKQVNEVLGQRAEQLSRTETGVDELDTPEETERKAS
ncbi:EAL domain-containing protein [Parasphingorhabdus sp. JC815]|uniref:putative bifunctional diguanylate cyclase/phosphodiesterase n=1 Tax=Parasphingorhabdus sp. JC815 TaxID=3232140 RepID=UPI0034586325